MNDEQHSWWQANKTLLLWARIIAILAFIAIVICGYYFKVEWTGLVKSRNFHSRTLWDWLQLLIVPAALALGVFWLNQRQQVRQLEAEETQRKDQLEVESQRAQDEAFQGYIDQMSQMISDKDQPLHSARPGEVLSLLALARTQTVLRRLNPQRKKGIVQFLAKLELIQSSQIDVLVNTPLTRRLIQDESEQDSQHRSPIDRKLRNPATYREVFHHIR